VSTIAPYQATAAFDPYDPSNHEYRGYIGTTDGTNYTAGLPPQMSIKINVPLVFWDSARIYFSEDGADLFKTYNAQSPAGAPFYYRSVNTQAFYFGSIDAGNPSQLNFTPVYNSFSNGQPSMSQWKSPIAAGIFQNGQQYNVTGPGLPAGGELVTINSSTPTFVSLPTPASPVPQVAQQYTFEIRSAASISTTDTFIQTNYPLTPVNGAATNNGVVMWYHALKSQQPNNDAPDQLSELSFRGTFYDPAKNPGTGFQYLLGSDSVGAITDSGDYDLSFVDSINLPIAMELTGVNIGNNPANQQDFGWVGSDQTIAQFQSALANFANGSYLGSYFGGKGWPGYLQVDQTNTNDIKLPAGQNVFLASPALPPGTPKSGSVSDIIYYKTFDTGPPIRSPLWALNSVGTGPSQLTFGSDQSVNPSKGNFLGLRTTEEADKYQLNNLLLPNFNKGLKYLVTWNDNGPHSAYAIAPYYQGQITDPKNKTGPIIGVELDRTAPTNNSNVYAFTQSIQDYAAGGITGLWYSWAKYYLDNMRSTGTTLSDCTVNNGNFITVPSTAGLIPGMAVTAGSSGSNVPPGCVILSIDQDKKTIELSTTVTGTSFKFTSPTFDPTKGFSGIAGYDPKNPQNTPMVTLSFNTAAEKSFALQFAQTVYVVMSAWSVKAPNFDPTQLNSWAVMMNDIIGGNTNNLYLPNANPDVVQTLTILSKSALRSVPDYTNSLYSNPAQWYPDPALPAGGQKYNVYNLNPFVWFIHEKLGITAYAFALDDDIGNVLGGGGSNLDIAIGGIDGLPKSMFPNKDPYTNQSQWGVLTTGGSSTQAKSSTIGGLTNTNLVAQIQQFNYSEKMAGALIDGPGVALGTTAQFTNINQNPSLTTITLSNPLSTSSTSPTFAAYGALTFTGKVYGSGQPTNTIYLDSQAAYNTLQKLGPFPDRPLQVTGEGIDPTQTVKISKLFQDGSNYVVQLSGSLNAGLISQKGSFYAYTFGYPAVPVLRDPGFEWPPHPIPPSQNFMHGKAATGTAPAIDWTYTDSTTNTKWFAGVAYNNSSDYTKGNPVPPQGLQVGFIQGDSSISQTVSLGQATYNLTLMAAQSAKNGHLQTLRVLVNGVLKGTINPRGTTYEQVTIPFATSRPGTYTIMFQGVEMLGDTVLLDSVACTLVSSQATALSQ
jgi:hypothetical protein